MDTNGYEQKMKQALGHFEEEIKKVRTGRAHPSMLDSVMVEAYGAKMPIKQVATVVAAEPQLLQVTPFDPSTLQAVVSAIREDQSLGMNPSDDGRIIRIPIPPLTTERRQEIVKQLGDKIEDCRITFRNVRHDALKDVKSKKDVKEISEDDQKRFEKQLDAMMNTYQTKLDQAAKAKEQEIMTI